MDNSEKILQLLEGISAKVNDMATRLAVFEDRLDRMSSLEERVRQLEMFQSSSKVYLAIAAFAGSTVTGIVVTVLIKVLGR